MNTTFRRSQAVAIPAEVFEDRRLSLRALGLLAYVLSRPDGWRMDPQDLADRLGITESMVDSLMRELARCGYAERASRRDGGRVEVTEVAAHALPVQRPKPSRTGKLKQATPACLTPEDLAAMAAIRRRSARLSAKTGVPHEVDHIVPLRGKFVWGLNAPWNLRIITGKQNAIKSNKVAS